MYKRILLKISGEALSGQEAPIGFDKVNAAAAEIASLAQKGLELGIVVGGGNIIRGRDAGSRDTGSRDAGARHGDIPGAARPNTAAAVRHTDEDRTVAPPSGGTRAEG